MPYYNDFRPLTQSTSSTTTETESSERPTIIPTNKLVLSIKPTQDLTEEIQAIYNVVFVNTKYLRMESISSIIRHFLSSYLALENPTRDNFVYLYENIAEVLNVNDHFGLYMARLWNHLQIYNPQPEYISMDETDICVDIPTTKLDKTAHIANDQHVGSVRQLVDFYESFIQL